MLKVKDNISFVKLEEYIDDLDYIAGIVKQNKELIKENFKLQQENKQLKEIIKELEKIFEKVEE